jgi:hypothetical protein
LTESRTHDFDLIRDTIKTTLDNALHQNKKLVEVLKYYATTDWRDLSMTDRGEVARKTLKEVTGK